MMHHDMCKKMMPLAPLVLRVVAGIIFIFHGWQKYTGGVEGFAGFLESLGVPMAMFFAFVVVAVEVVGGALLILGALTRVVSVLLAIDMLFALILVHAQNGFSIMERGYEFVLLLLAVSVALAITGAGQWSADHMFGKHKKMPAPAPENTQ